MITVHLPTQPSKGAEFKKFAGTRYLPSPHTQPSGAGELHVAHLLRAIFPTDLIADNQRFLMLVAWEGVAQDRLPRVDDPAVQAELEAFAPKIETLGHFRSLVWPPSWQPIAFVGASLIELRSQAEMS